MLYTKNGIPASSEDLQECIQSVLDSGEIEANAAVVVCNIHKQTMMVCPVWECENAEELPKMAARLLMGFADVAGTGESIGAYAFRDDKIQTELKGL